MKPLNYYEFGFCTSESKVPNSKFYNDPSKDKLFSKLKNEFGSKEYLDNQLFFPEGNDHYTADQKIPNEGIKFYDFYLDENARNLDDFMRSIEVNQGFGFFVSPKCKKILSDFVLPSHKYYPLKIIKNEIPLDFYFLLIAKNEIKIDYENSTFVERFKKTNEVKVSSYNDLLTLKEKSGSAPAIYKTADIKEKAIVFNEAPDIYPVVTRSSAFFYFSESLKNTLEKEKMTGFEFYKASDPQFFSNK